MRGGLWVTLGSYWTIGLGFAANIVLTRLLAPEVFGVFALGMFFAQLLRIQPKLALGFAFAQHKETTGEVLGTYVFAESLTILGGLLLSLLAVPVLSWLGYSRAVVQVSVVLACVLVLEGAAGTGATLLDKELRFRPASFVQSLAFPLSYIPAFWLATHHGGIWSLVTQTFTYNALFLAGISWVVRRQTPHLWQVRWRVSPTLARQFLSFGITVGLALLAGMLLTQSDNFMIGTFVGVAVLGFYDRAYRTAQWSSTLLNSLIARTAFFTYARLQDDSARLQKAVEMVLWLITTLAMPLALVMVITAPDLLALLYGERWLPSAPFLRILAVISVMRPLWENAGTLFVAIGEPRTTTKFTLVQVAVLVIAGLPLTILWGAFGTCIAVGLAFGVGTWLIYRHMLKQVPIRLLSSLGMPLLASLLTLLGYLAINRLAHLTDVVLWVRVLIKIAYAMSMFFALAFAFQPRATRERVSYIWRLALHSGR